MFIVQIIQAVINNVNAGLQIAAGKRTIESARKALEEQAKLINIDFEGKQALLAQISSGEEQVRQAQINITAVVVIMVFLIAATYVAVKLK